MADAIIYTTNTGSTQQYAEMLSQQIGLPAYALAQAKHKISKNAEVIYLGWIMASSVKGYTDAAKRYQICAVCAVGMGQTGTNAQLIREKNHIPDNVPVFTLQGNFHVEKLHGMYRILMNAMVKVVSKGLSEKTDRTAEEDDMLDMMLRGGERVKEENLTAVLEWLGQARSI